MSNKPENKIKSKEDIPLEYRWQLEDIFATDEAWEEALSLIPALEEKLFSFKGRLAQDAKTLAAALKAAQELDLELMELIAYARMRRDEDNSVGLYQDMTDRATSMYYKTAMTTAFLSPEIAAIDEDTLLDWIQTEEGFSTFRHQLKDLLRSRPHLLPEQEEALLSRFGPVAEGIGQAYTMLDNVDLKLGSIADGSGGTIELTPAVFGQLREHRNRTVRRDAFEKIHLAFQGFGQTFASLYATQIKSDIVFALARKHEDSLSAALFADNLPVSLYKGLIESVHRGQTTLNRYLSLRQQTLKLDSLNIYDTYVPLVDMPERRYTYEQAKGIIERGLAVLGPDYQDALKRHLTSRWIDVYETPGKTSGAFSWGTYRSHPYILLNYSGTLSDLFTLAHELGHSLHTWFSNRSQPYSTAHYPIFLAEIASTVNEILLVHALIAECDQTTEAGLNEKKYLLNHFLESFRLTVFRQTMFAEFEWIAHRLVEQGEALTADTLCSIYGDLLRQYFGPDVVIDDFMRWEWARIPHFYNAFYVFKYATGFSAAVAIASQIIEEGQPAVDRYLKFLSMGGSDYPLNLLRIVGIDLSGPQPVDLAMKTFADRLAELSALME